MSPTTRLEWQPDTWNSGEVSRDTVWAGRPAPTLARPAGASAAAAIALLMVLKIVFWRLAIMLRWVEMAPLGRPVVPLV